MYICTGVGKKPRNRGTKGTNPPKGVYQMYRLGADVPFTEFNILNGK